MGTVTRIFTCFLFLGLGSTGTWAVAQETPYYHTNHDTMDRLSRDGLENAVEFHMGLLVATGAIAN